MKTKILIALILLATGSGIAQAAPLGTAITYQGWLNYGGATATGIFDMRFTIYDLETGGSPVSGPITNATAAVSNGLFTAVLDFGPGSFAGNALWLELAVRTNGASDFTALTPRQLLAPSPHALYAPVAGSARSASNLLGILPASQLSGTYTNPLSFNNTGNSFTGGGSSLTGLNASQLTIGTVPGARLSGTYAGALTFNNPANAFTGSGAGLTSLNGAALSAGSVSSSALAANAVNSSKIEDGSILAADINTASLSNTVWMLSGNAGTVPAAQFLGTTDNKALELRVNNQRVLRFEPNVTCPNVIGGYLQNSVASNVVGATISGGGEAGYINSANGNFSSVGGGYWNTIEGGSTGGTISGGAWNTLQTNASSATVGGGWQNTIQSNAVSSTISGGAWNTIQRYVTYATIGGGQNNQILISSADATIGGGMYNAIQGNCYESTISGGNGNSIWTDSYDSAIGGGTGNVIEPSAPYSSISGGYANKVRASANRSSIGGGNSNNIQTNSSASTISGGYFNTIDQNSAESSIGGGKYNTIRVNAGDSVIGGGSYNTNAGAYATVPGGYLNFATNYSLAAGARAKAMHSGSLVWADTSPADFPSVTNNEAAFRCSGGVRFTDGGAQSVSWIPGAGAWSFTSDRNAKEVAGPVDGKAVLDKVAQLGIAEWNYRGCTQRHIGPMAQDFHALFPFNENTTLLNSADLDGVALAAIQGLNEKLDESRAENAQLKRRLDNLEQRVLRISVKEEREGL